MARMRISLKLMHSLLTAVLCHAWHKSFSDIVFHKSVQDIRAPVFVLWRVKPQCGLLVKCGRWWWWCWWCLRVVDPHERTQINKNSRKK